MKKILLFASFVLTGIIFSTCDRKEEDKTPIACFTPTATDAAVSELIAFNNCSTDAETYSWNFGDGSATTSEVSPSHSYTAAGQYSVTLKAWYKNNVDEETQVINITGGNTTQPVACINPSTTSAEVNQNITFSNCSADATSFSWNFGDGSAASTASAPTHAYTAAGTYTVTLTAYNGDKSDQETVSITITGGSSSDPVACFTLDIYSATVNQYIYTTNCSQNAISYEWDLDNNGTVETTDANPIIYFTAIGTYTIKLTAINGSKTNSVTKNVEITEGITDPRVYDISVLWDTHYLNEFDVTNDDWAVGTGDGYENAISGGFYTIKNTLTDSYWTFSTNAAGMPASSQNYDMEMYFKVVNDAGGYGDGLFWAKESGAFNYYFYLFSPGSSSGYYLLGDLNAGAWSYWMGTDWVAGGDQNGYNRLTIRKYGSNYYFFLNKEFKFTYPYTVDFGEKFGFWSGPSSEMSVDWIGIWTVSTKKAGMAGENPGKKFVQQTHTKGTNSAIAKKINIDQIRTK